MNITDATIRAYVQGLAAFYSWLLMQRCHVGCHRKRSFKADVRINRMQVVNTPCSNAATKARFLACLFVGNVKPIALLCVSESHYMRFFLHHSL